MTTLIILLPLLPVLLLGAPAYALCTYTDRIYANQRRETE